MEFKKGCLILVTCFFLTACGKQEVVGTEKMGSQTRQLSAFSGINVSGFYDVTIKVGAPQSITVTANSNLLPYIESTVSGKELSIQAKKGYMLRPTATPAITIVTPEVKRIELNGNNQVTVNGVAKGDLDLDFSGSNQFTATGNVENLTIKLAGEAIVDAAKLIANNVDIDSNGSSKINVYARDNLKVNIAGISTVNYAGNPKITQTINGSGKITKLPEVINK